MNKHIVELYETIMNELEKQGKIFVKGGKLMTLYVVHGNNYFDGYGHIETVFGIYTEKSEAEAARDLVAKRFIDEHTVEAMWIDIKVTEIETNKPVEIELGGYCE